MALCSVFHLRFFLIYIFSLLHILIPNAHLQLQFFSVVFIVVVVVVVPVHKRLDISTLVDAFIFRFNITNGMPVWQLTLECTLHTASPCVYIEQYSWQPISRYSMRTNKINFSKMTVHKNDQFIVHSLFHRIVIISSLHLMDHHSQCQTFNEYPFYKCQFCWNV